MPRYVAKFMKRVLNDSGHQTTIVQRALDLDAQDRNAALELAKKCFCELEGISSWDAHADEVIVEEADFPS